MLTSLWRRKSRAPGGIARTVARLLGKCGGAGGRYVVRYDGEFGRDKFVDRPDQVSFFRCLGSEFLKRLQSSSL